MEDVENYLQKLDEPERLALERIRQIISDIYPDAVQLISYGIPGFKYKGKYLAGYAAFKDHLSFFPASDPIAVFKDELKGYKTARGTVQFTLDQPIAAELIKRMVRHRAKDIDNHSK